MKNEKQTWVKCKGLKIYLNLIIFVGYIKDSRVILLLMVPGGQQARKFSATTFSVGRLCCFFPCIYIYISIFIFRNDIYTSKKKENEKKNYNRTFSVLSFLVGANVAIIFESQVTTNVIPRILRSKVYIQWNHTRCQGTRLKWTHSKFYCVFQQN